jgi:hypothetical protein
MDNNRDTVLCQPNVKLYPVCAIGQCALERQKRIFRSDCRRAAMANDEDSGQWAVGSGQ